MSVFLDFILHCSVLTTQDVKYVQTDGYRAPEAELQNSLAQAGLEVDSGCTAAIDLWSLGIILLELYSGIKLKETVRSQEWKVSERWAPVVHVGDCPQLCEIRF